jgi:transcriptional regulator with PAS, ATPase and Fis domain
LNNQGIFLGGGSLIDVNLSAYDIINSLESGTLIVDESLELVFLNPRGYKYLGIEDESTLKEILPQILYEFGLQDFITGNKHGARNIVTYNGNELIIHVVRIENNEFGGAMIHFHEAETYRNLRVFAENEVETTSLLNTIMDATNDCFVYVNKDGIVEMLSKAYAEFLKVDREKAIGSHVRDVIENTRMDVVIKTGKPEIAQVQEIRGRNMIATRIPVFTNGKTVGKVLFRDVDELNSLYMEINKIEKELNLYKDEFRRVNKAKYAIENIIGESQEMLKLKDVTKKVANTTSTVLILGESGTGKELFAHAIHNNSSRKNSSFIKVNCGAIPYELLESELFGYEEGSFTGAKKGGKIGKFKAADGGTIFLDEIAELPMNMQAKLLRVLQDREIEKIGSTKSEKVDVRVIAATNKNLEEMVDRGAFRLDLYYRLNVVSIRIPSLRERKEDIPILSKHLVDKISKEQNVNVESVSSKAMEFLINYKWPGNVRELENILERAVNFLDGESKIMTNHLPPKVTGMSGVESVRSLKETMDQIEKEVLTNSLILAKGNKSEAAEALGISRTSLYEKLNKHNIRM